MYNSENIMTVYYTWENIVSGNGMYSILVNIY